MRRSVQIKAIVILLLLMLMLCIWYAIAAEDRRGLLIVSFLDIGQGDAIFIEAPTGRQVLIDGGAGTAVLRRLSGVMPWFDRTIDVVIGTHPDQDHIGGLIDTLARYKVAMIAQSSVTGDTPIWDTFRKKVAEEGGLSFFAKRGQIIALGEGAYLEILFPDRDVSNVDTNTGCIVARVVYGITSFMLPCDAPQAIENYLVRLDGSGLQSNVLKAGHHGSKTSSGPLFLGYVAPEYGVFSRGCNNSYGHPAAEVVARFAQFEIPTLDTCTEGTVTFVSDGSSVRRR